MRAHRYPGTFIVVDGSEGTGKSTQLRLLRETLQQQFPDRELVFTREPGGTPFAENIRKLVISGFGSASAKTLFALMTASRFDHVERVVLPALARGAIIVSDCYEGSSYAYQVFAPDTDELQPIFCAHQQLIPAPNLTLVLTVPAEVTLARIEARRGQTANAFDLAGREFHERVAEGFRWYARHWAGHRVIFINGNCPEEAVTASLMEHAREAIN